LAPPRRPLESQASQKTARPTAEDSAALIATLTALEHMLAESDMGAIEAVAGSRTEFRNLTNPASDPLDQAISDLDFEGAQRHCRDGLAACQARADSS
jgi:hypothetical protein